LVQFSGGVERHREGSVVPRFFLHIKHGARLIRDTEGSVHASVHAARAEALVAAREICANAIRAGRSAGADAIIITDEADQWVMFVPLDEALATEPRPHPPAQGEAQDVFEIAARQTPII
jgi:hypothetical protein